MMVIRFLAFSAVFPILLTSVFSMASIDKTPLIVFVKKAKATDIFSVLTYPARVESKVNATIYSEGEGVVSRVVAPLGTKVSKRSKVLVIRHIDPVYQYAPMVVLSPVIGIVSQLKVSEGSYVTNGEALLSVTDPKSLRFVVEVAAQDIQNFKTGMTGEFSIGNDKPIPVKVHGISAFVDPATGTTTCEFTTSPDHMKNLLPGLIGQVTMKIDQHKGFVFPESAVDYEDSGPILKIVRGGKALKVPVKLGRTQKGLIEILSGIAENDEVIERASRFVANGEAVQVESAPGVNGKN